MISEPIANRKSDSKTNVKSDQEKMDTPTLSKNYSVFCVDDDIMMRLMLQKTLTKNSSFDVAVFENGEDCVKALRSQPDIAVLDYHLTDVGDDSIMNGLDVLDKIKQHSPNTKVIMLSSQDKIEVAVKCLKKGASDYVIKDNVMRMNVEKAIHSIIRGIELKEEIKMLSQRIKRDKLLMKGYFVLVMALIFLVVYLLF